MRYGLPTICMWCLHHGHRFELKKEDFNSYTHRLIDSDDICVDQDSCQSRQEQLVDMIERGELTLGDAIYDSSW